MDNIILNKIETIKRCLKRIEQDYIGYEKEFEDNYMRQDSIILNIQRACEAAIDLGTRIVRIKKLGLPQTSRDIFILLEKNSIIPPELSKKMQAMVGFRNIAVHDYQKMNLDIVKSIITTRLEDFNEFIKCCKNF